MNDPRSRYERRSGVHLAQRSKHLRRDQEEGAVQEEARLFRRIANSNLMGIAAGRLDGGIDYANDEMLRLMDISREEFESRTADWEACLAPEAREALGDSLAALRRGEVVRCESAFSKRDGGRTPVLSRRSSTTWPGSARESSCSSAHPWT